jgi:hypothetical protein
VSNSLFAVAFDCADAAALARFWAEVLGRQIAERLLSLGARRLRDLHADKIRWTTFADIEGTEFDLIAG